MDPRGNGDVEMLVVAVPAYVQVNWTNYLILGLQLTTASHKTISPQGPFSSCSGAFDHTADSLPSCHFLRKIV